MILGAALKGGTLCGAKKVANLIVYGLLVGSVAPAVKEAAGAQNPEPRWCVG